MTTTTPAVLDHRALNRAYLARQMLLSRHRTSASAAIESLVGLQSQQPVPPYYGLWTRLADFRPEELSRLISERAVTRIVVMRGTVHLVTADDALALRPWVQPCLDRGMRSAWGKDLAGIELSALAGAARELLGARHLSTTELGGLLGERWPGHSPSLLVNAARVLLPLVQVPPRGLWGRSARTTYATAESWLGRPLVPEPPAGELVVRYLAAFGPATVKDVQAWSGLTRLRETMARLRPRLAVFRDTAGRELFDLPEAPRPGPDTPAPVRYLAPYDNAILSHADRTRIIDDAGRRAIATKNAVIPGTVLVDGFVRGAWRIDERRGTATLTVQPFTPLTARQRDELAEEGERLLAFGAETAGERLIRFAEPLGG
ncbi:winged helix DNA-binding domain-containing protein [Streptomyces xinghaiensis]|uniref:winged helix DNA-binding domain-containing protein n=1 Tax=Streptomyces xinghaiensis TaxID=1038928 RepID=UPI00378D92B4